ncbi:unnamed protein product [Protopolystoma xenopodis]|uniref:Uncharacterized protein n=1 Tax=Protopolystoma xenopodis TaxID=117903 RepID=A0A448X1I0_9PLAT|nr:unnamed protein product [Protopolystoma xenopodis]
MSFVRFSLIPSLAIHLSCMLQHNNICLFGGWDEKTCRRLSDVICVSLSAPLKWRSWRLSQLPDGMAISLASAIALEDGRVFLVGGSRQGGAVLSSTFILDSETARWTVGPSLQTSRSDFGLCKVGQRIFAIGGYGRECVMAVCPASKHLLTHLSHCQLYLLPFFNQPPSWTHVKF